jgi:L-seryl-tRNA(Ser) seleniumtransferase
MMMKNKRAQEIFSQLPAVHQLLSLWSSSRLPHEILVRIVREEIKEFKKSLGRSRQDLSKADMERDIQTRIQMRIERLRAPSLKRVINGTGVILHTGLGRAPLSAEAKAQVLNVMENYCNLELDLESGERGERLSHVEELLCLLTGAEASAVVNNNAAAVLVLLNSLAFQKEVIISRGELVEIGGSFRIPEVMEKSGAVMREVGTTNKTHERDFEKAISKRTALLMRVHTSNYRVVGFTHATELKELVAIGKKYKVPVAYDLGGGALMDLKPYGLAEEPVVQDSVRAGADVVTFSGDKILGGCQAGLLVGKKKFVDRIKKNPLMRALRCDKITYAVLESTLKLYVYSGTSPVLTMLHESLDDVRARASRISSALQNRAGVTCTIQPADAQAGSGTLPLERIPSLALKIGSAKLAAHQLAGRLRKNDPPILGYVRGDAFFLDMRTVRKDEVDYILKAFQAIS